MEPRDNTNSNKSEDKRPSCQSPARGGCCSKKNISKSASTSGDKTAGKSTNNNVKMGEEAPIATTST